MKVNFFGREREQLSVLGLGCSRIGSFGNSASFSDIRRTVDRAIELGINVFDTADIYGQGDSERALGKFFKGRRQKVFIVSKVGKCFSLKMRMVRPFKPLLRPLTARSSGARTIVSARRGDNMRADFSAAYLEKALERSLKRLQFDTLDALLLHSPTAEQLRSGEIEPLLLRLRCEGKIRHYGVSCDDKASLLEALKFEDLSLLELPVDLIESIRKTDVWPKIAARQIGVLAREAIALRPELSPGAAISEVLKSGDITCVVAGTSRPAHLDELARAIA
ncbi:MAG: aldo/keto reductase [Bradyrhizobium sp.]|nr:aldo/keto reductase [Bradyrhizobium sp.]